MSNVVQMAERAVRIPPIGLAGDLSIPRGAAGIVVFAHGSGSSRHSPRNRFVAETLNRAGLATLLFDLLTAQEEAIDARTSQLRFDVGLLAQRLSETMDWLQADSETRDLIAGFFGASTGGAAALVAAGQRPEDVFAVVSRGGRPDLAGEWLARVRAPTLLVVGDRDDGVIELNREALARIPAEHKRLDLIPGATHLFEEPGTLDKVAVKAGDWFNRYLRPRETAG
jgi:putative phosphoribosyl transferase